jgi:hypothetical protein
MMEGSNINNKNHRTQEPTHVEETCTDRKGIKKRRKNFIKKRKQDYNIPCFKLRVQVRRAKEKAKRKNDCSEMCEAPESKKRKKGGRALPRVVESKEKRQRARAASSKRTHEHTNY